MKKLLLISLLITALVGVLTVSMVAAAKAPADGLAMDYPGAKAKYAPIKFNHSTHAALACEKCHHKMNEASDMKCTSCHSDTSKAAKRNPEGYDYAFHNRKSESSCVGCHKSMKSGPTKCNDCHTK